jgi:hypothetical protein
LLKTGRGPDTLNPGNKLQMNWPYVVIAALIGTGTIGFIIWGITAPLYRASVQGLPIRGGWNWTTVIGCDVGCLFVLLAFYWKMYCDAKTEIGEAELSRPSIFGPRRIRWSEVVRVKIVGFGCHILSKDKKIVLSPYAYRDPDSVVSLIKVRIPVDKDDVIGGLNSD